MVCGPNGCGKTALVRRIPGAIYVDAAGLSAAGVLHRVYEGAFIADPVCVPTPERLRKLLEGRREPIVIDEFAGTVDDLRMLVETLNVCPVVYTAVEAELVDPSVAELRLTGLRDAAARELFERASGMTLGDDDPNVALVSGPLEGNPLLILQAAALARAGKLPPVQNAATLAAAVFNGMTIGEQQVFATVAGFNGARPDKATVEAVSGVANASGVISSLVARHAIERDGERLWISPLMYSVTKVAPSLMRYDALFDYLDRTLEEEPLPSGLLENPAAMLVGLRFAMSKSRHTAVMAGSRRLSEALLLAGNVDGARQAAELVREAANELRDGAMQAWAAHQLGTLSVLTGDKPDAVTWLETAVSRRERLGDEDGMHRSLENLALVRGEPSPAARRTKKKKTGGGSIGRDLGMIVAAMGLAAVVVAVYSLVWRPSHRVARHERAVKHVAVASHAMPPDTPLQFPGNLSALAALRPVPRPALVKTPAAALALAPKKGAPTVAAAPPPPPAIAPHIVRFAATAANIRAGQSTSLCYDVRDASSAAIDDLGPVAPGASCTKVEPRRTTRYLLTASRGSQRVVASAAIMVSAPVQRRPLQWPRILRFSTTARRIIEGQYTQLCFSLQHATSAVLEPVGPLSSSRSGCVNVSPQIDTFYTLYARNAKGVVSRSLHVAVQSDDILDH